MTTTLNFYFGTIFACHINICFEMPYGMYFQIISKWSTLSWHGSKWPNLAFQSVCLPVSLIDCPSTILSLHLVPALFTSDLCRACPFSYPNSALSVGPGDHSSAQTGGTGSCLQPLCFLVCVPLFFRGFLQTEISLHPPPWIKAYFYISFQILRGFETSSSHDQNTLKVAGGIPLCCRQKLSLLLPRCL